MLVPVAVGVTIIVFFMIHLIPGDPARTILGIHATPQRSPILHREWGLNRPLISQYWLFLDRLAARQPRARACSTACPARTLILAADAGRPCG